MKAKLLILLILSKITIFSQISTNEKPISYKLVLPEIEQNSKNVKILKRPDINRLLKEDLEGGGNKELPPRFGFKSKVNYNLDNSGEWKTLKNGDKILYSLEHYQ